MRLGRATPSIVLGLVGLVGVVFAAMTFAACPEPAFFTCAEDEDCAADQECSDDHVCRDKPPALGLEGEGEGGEGEGEGGEGEGEGGEGEGEGGEGEGEGEGEGGEGEGEGEGEPVTCLPIDGATVATFQQHCYVAFSTNESWERAVVRCASLGGYIAVPSSIAEHELVRSSLVPVGFDPFVGLTDAHDEGQFTSIVGESLPTALAPFFNGGEPNDGGAFGGPENCVEYLETNDGNDVLPGWNDERCVAVDEGANVTSTLCELPFDGVTGFCGDGVVQAAFGECGPATDPGSCPVDCTASFTPDVGYEALADRVLVGFASPRSFSSALDACESLGGTLAIPDSAESDDRVTQIITRLGGASLWIGYTDRFNEADDNAGQFHRVDNSQEIGDGFEAFAVGEPNASASDEDCVEARANGAGWNDIACGDAKGFVCELK